ncbi:MAG: Gfo/Idh/MocA family oxidoreductase [Phycisphaerales bacterium]
MAFNLGIIGAGAIGNVHADTAVRAGINVAGVWDVQPTKGAAFGSKHKGAKVCGSITELLAIKEIPAVVVAVPNNLHAEVAIQALEAGKIVFLEKPMALNAAECDRILQALDTTKGRLQMGFVCRGTPASSTVKHFIQAGRFGRIYHLKASLYRRRGVPGLGGWFTTKSQSGGGPLIDLGVHVLDLALYLAGNATPQRVSGATYANFGVRMKDYVYTDMWAGPPKLGGVFDVEDHATALIRCAGGLTIELNVTWAMNVPESKVMNGMTVFGDQGGCFFPIFGREVTIATEAERRVVDLTPEISAGNTEHAAWDAQYRMFSKLVLEGTPPHADARAGRMVQAVLDAVYESSAAGREVDVR